MVAIGNGGGSASVLDATGYVVARRMATVSAKITGKVREVLIEEGQHVEAGQVMATLDPIDADAQRDLAAAQLGAARSQAGSVQAQLREAEANAARLGALVEAAAGVEVAVRPGHRAARLAARAAGHRAAQRAGRRRPAARSPTTASTTPSCARRSPAW